ncbi:NAD(P)/FAD-dependent oxidoreductase [Mesorhizobium humile]|uniref:FAD-binding oxidoreductase n=1 Tax=Mesorhizobium humile TaxID=3072313 RepID=A0ABU4YI20_9HYPH|nr:MULTISPECIES: FAD-binding oxidoreductase [unclassified Mesorhizobium]MDX8461871.1 FAD-binding oxidoreductase [Mesorhizobium sp. VK2D]MDX8486625.1 FAD-binding oxidoreductase [Mesorhizobium sp. VK2B]
MTNNTALKAVVVGAGVFGVSTAFHLARLGVQTTIVNDGAVANGASSRSLAWLNSARKRSAAYHKLRIQGLERYKAFAASHDCSAWLRFDGGLTWDADDASNQIAEIHRHEQSIGYQTQLLAPSELSAVTPGVDPRAVSPQGAIFNAGEGWVDLPSLINLLLAEFRERGGRILSDAGSADVTLANGRVSGVKTTSGEVVGADVVVVATGPAVPAMAAKVGRHIGDGTTRALLVFSKPVPHPLRAVLNTPRVAIRPTPNGAFALDSAWSEEEVIVRDDGTYEAKPSTIAGLLKEASSVLEGNPRLVLQSLHVGPKPIPADGEPVVGQLTDIPGYHVVFSHSGATLGLIAGELLAGEIVSGTANPLLEPFRPSRFDG